MDLLDTLPPKIEYIPLGLPGWYSRAFIAEQMGSQKKADQWIAEHMANGEWQEGFWITKNKKVQRIYALKGTPKTKEAT